jgi:hypothetical protein
MEGQQIWSPFPCFMVDKQPRRKSNVFAVKFMDALLGPKVIVNHRCGWYSFGSHLNFEEEVWRSMAFDDTIAAAPLSLLFNFPNPPTAAAPIQPDRNSAFGK